MSFNTAWATVSVDARVRTIGDKLARIRALAAAMTSGTSRMRSVISGLRTMDVIYDETVPVWTDADIVALRTSAENAASQAVTSGNDLEMTSALVLRVGDPTDS